MILYKKAPQLRVRRASAPAAPFWSATVIAPYAARRATPIAIDYAELRASGAEKLEVTVTENVRDELDRARAIAAPVLIDAAENAEDVFRRGAEALAWCDEQGLAAQILTSEGSVVRLSDADRFGIAVPVLFPLTTDPALLESLADSARDAGASFFAAIPIDAEPTAKQAIAQTLPVDDDLYAMLFHSDLGPIQLATERHIAALAAERGMADFILPPRWPAPTNWNAAVLLTLVASRMIALELDLDLAGVIARSARTIAELDKPLTRVAESASLSIIGGVDETSVEMLTEWLGSGSAAFLEFVNEQWRLRRV
ncbi:MAG TPA: hypothetical protein VF432_22730 [Thermoanaerobaculia bacterium]